MMREIAVSGTFCLWVGLVLALGCGGSGDGGEDTPLVESEDNQPSELSENEQTRSGDETDCQEDSRTACSPCDCDEQCGEEGVCIDLLDQGSRCTTRCSLSLNDCPAGYYCGLTGTTTADFHCIPEYGQCEGDGNECSPCGEGAECNDGFVCHESSVDLAPSCYRECSGDADCEEAAGFGTVCEDELCVPVLDKPRDICNTGQRGLCEPCAYNFDCAEPYVCSGNFCTESCEKLSGVSSTCAEGMFCVGDLCGPPPAYKCQGWLGCSFGCDSNEVCVSGICRIPCDAGCPFGLPCDDDGLYCTQN